MVEVNGLTMLGRHTQITLIDNACNIPQVWMFRFRGPDQQPEDKHKVELLFISNVYLNVDSKQMFLFDQCFVQSALLLLPSLAAPGWWKRGSIQIKWTMGGVVWRAEQGHSKEWDHKQKCYIPIRHEAPGRNVVMEQLRELRRDPFRQFQKFQNK